MKQIVYFILFSAVFFSLSSCTPTSKFEGSWIPDSNSPFGILQVDNSNIYLQTISVDSFGKVSSCSYDSFPFKLKKTRGIKGSWDVIRLDDESVFGRFHTALLDSLITDVFVWVKPDQASLSDSVDFMLKADMDWLRGDWGTDTDSSGLSTSYSFISDDSYHAGIVYRYSAGISFPGAFFVCDSLVHLSFGGLLDDQILKINPDQSVSDSRGNKLLKVQQP